MFNSPFWENLSTTVSLMVRAKARSGTEVGNWSWGRSIASKTKEFRAFISWVSIGEEIEKYVASSGKATKMRQ